MFDFKKLSNGDFAKITDLCMCSIIITDANSDIVYVNDFFTETTGYTRDEVMGCNPRILQSGHMPAKHYEEMWDVLIQGHEWNGEFLNKDKAGISFWEFARIMPLRDVDGNVFYLAVKQNITPLKDLEEKLAVLYDKIDRPKILP